MPGHNKNVNTNSNIYVIHYVIHKIYEIIFTDNFLKYSNTYERMEMN